MRSVTAARRTGCTEVEVSFDTEGDQASCRKCEHEWRLTFFPRSE
ncbi:hypothetical protein BH10ACT1_BH10ACT1_33430 [soil metagenome]